VEKISSVKSVGCDIEVRKLLKIRICGIVREVEKEFVINTSTTSQKTEEFEV
jgi:hypothetical protein